MIKTIETAPRYKKGDLVTPTRKCIAEKVAMTAGRPMNRPDLPYQTEFENKQYRVKEVGAYSSSSSPSVTRWHVLVEGSTQFVHEDNFTTKVDYGSVMCL